MIGLPEVILQTGAFSFLLVTWHRKPTRWMNVVAIIGFVLVVLGLAASAYQGFTYTTRETVLDIGPLHATADREKRVTLPPVFGVVAVVGGVALVVAGSRLGRSA